MIDRLRLCLFLLCFISSAEWSHAQSSDLPTDTRASQSTAQIRQRISINSGWRFYKYESALDADELIYDVRPDVENAQDDRPADARPTAAESVTAKQPVLKPWILPTGNNFIADPSARHRRPQGESLGSDFAFVQSDFDDKHWRAVELPHDWAIAGPFQPGWQAPVGGGMGRLPSPGVAWYRRRLDLPRSDEGKSIFLDVDGAMSYAMVWLNGHLVGGWPYGYSSWRVDLTPYVKFGGDNQLAIRLDNPPNSSRWYPGGGIYRNVWLTKTNSIHIGHWGTFVTTPDVSEKSARISLRVSLDNDSEQDVSLQLSSQIFALDSAGQQIGEPVATFETVEATVPGNRSLDVNVDTTINQPRLWGPPPSQTPHQYTIVTQLTKDDMVVDRYTTPFGIRELRFDANQGVLVNGKHIYLQGVNQHHDLGALGAAFNVRAAERQLELLEQMGCNAIRMAHNPPSPELLELTDRMGFLIVDELYDSWERKKAPLDFHLIYPEWHEQDLRALIRRDRNHPSVIMWSLGNEVGEQFTAAEGAAVASELQEIAKSEDPTRPTATSMNYAKPDMELPPVLDTISLNYQGEGIRNAPEYVHLKGIRTAPLYPKFHATFPDKLILSSENAAALSSRGEYMFPVTPGVSAPVSDEPGGGGDPVRQQVSGYELYTAPFGSSADKVLASLEQHPYVGGGFVWSGWDYLGEPTPYYEARSSYYGVIDLAGFPKDRFYLYQSQWRPQLPMVHVLPHWTWPDRVGKVTPVHLFTSGDEAELFLNGKSLGRKQKRPYEYRLRWDDVIYEPGTLEAVAYKAGEKWATKTVKTTDLPAKIELSPDRNLISADGIDLCFVTAKVVDSAGLVVPQANHVLEFQVEGPGEIVATDNGDPTSLVAFPYHQRAAFNGLCLVIVRGITSEPGKIKITATSTGLAAGETSITANR